MNDATDPAIPRARLRADLVAARLEFRAMVNAVSDRAWAEPSLNPGWSNGQLLFHVLFGFILVLPLSRLLVFFGHLPDVCSRSFAGALNLSTQVVNRINVLGPRIGARLLDRATIMNKFDHVHGAVVARLDRARARDWTLTMRYPTRWDPRFHTQMRLADLFQYPVDHLRHHRSQLRAT